MVGLVAGFLAFLFFVPIFHIPYPQGDECMPEYLADCVRGHFDSFTLVVSEEHGMSWCGARYLPTGMYVVFCNGREWVIAAPQMPLSIHALKGATIVTRSGTGD